jgi:hypothetical protein
VWNGSIHNKEKINICNFLCQPVTGRLLKIEQRTHVNIWFSVLPH